LLRPSKFLPQTLMGRVFLLYSVSMMLFAGTGLGWWATRNYQESIAGAKDTASTLISLLGPAVSESAVIGDYDTIGRALEQAARHADLQGGVFTDMKGGKLAQLKHNEQAPFAPHWLLQKMAEELPDAQQRIEAGGKPYGTLSLQFAVQRIAGNLWRQTTLAAGMTFLALLSGLLVVWVPLHHWLGSLDRIRNFGEQMQVSGGSLTQMLDPNAPLEFRKTFEALNQAATSLQLEREQAAVTLSAIADGVATLNADERVVLVNPVLTRLLGKPSTPLLGQRIQDILPGLLDDMPASGEWSKRIRVHDGQGQTRVLDLSRSPIGVADAHFGWVLAFRDVSQAQALEDQLRAELQARSQAMSTMRQLLADFANDANAAVSVRSTIDDIDALLKLVSSLIEQLRERGEQLAAIFALSPDGFVSFDRSARVRYVSPAFTRLSGLPAEAVMDTHEDDLLSRLLQSAESPTHPLSFDTLRHGKHKIELERPSRRVLELAAHTASSGAIAQVLHVKDVTHEVEVDQMKSEFLSTAAHELRTPITSVYGFTELLMSREFSPEKQKTMLERIHRQSAAMITILNELLDLSRIEARRGKDFTLEAVHLPELIAEALNDFQPPDGRARPDAHITAEQVRVNVDRSKLLQVMRNLLSNAYKYSPKGGAVEIRVRPLAEASTPSVCIEVQDHGIGMSADEVSHVTERFYRADKSGAILGTGLGMSIVKEIIDLLGGQLHIDSTPGSGTKVTVWLPIIQARSAALTA